MKSCWLARGSLAAYLDGELAHRSAQRVESHVRICPRCQGELDELRRMTLLLRSLPRPVRPNEYWPYAIQELRSKIQRLPRQTRYSPLDRFREVLEHPSQALIPVALVCVAIVNTLVILGLEEEAFAIFSSYLLPIVLD